MKSALGLGDRVTIPIVYKDQSQIVRARPYYHTRTFVIEEASDCPVLVGQSVMPRWSVKMEKQAHRNKRQLTWRAEDVTNLVFEDLYALHRALSHVLDRYETNEVPRLTTAIGYCHALHGVVLGLRKDNFQDLIQQIESLVDQVVEVIGIRVKDNAKDAALERIIITRKGLDSLNRVNSSASCLRMLSVVGDLISRESSVGHIAEIYAGRRQAVRLVLVALETQVMIVEDFLNQILDNWNIVKVRRRELTAAQLDQFVQVLNAIPVKPFSATFRHVAREFAAAATFIRAGHLDRAKPLLVTAAASMRLRRLRVQFEAIHYRVASAVHDVAMRKQSSQIAQVALADLSPLIDELKAVDTLGMVAFPVSEVLFSFAEAQSALAEGNCVVATDNLRLALRAI